MKTKDERIKEALDELKELDDLLTERIADLHDIKGMMQARHAYVLYRQKVWNVRDILRKSTP